jgi:hypothetical protein
MIISEQAHIKLNGKWMVLKAILVSKPGGHRVVYINAEGTEVYNEPLCRSQFKGIKLD